MPKVGGECWVEVTTTMNGLQYGQEEAGSHRAPWVWEPWDNGGLATGHEASLSFPSVHWEPDYTVDMQEEVGTALWAGITIKGRSGEREIEVVPQID